MPHRILNLWNTTNDIIGGDDDGPGLGIAEYLGGRTSTAADRARMASMPKDVQLARSGAQFSGNDEASQFNAMRHDNWNATQIRVQDALKAGINPLAALGVSSNVSPTMMSTGANNGTSGGRFSNIAKAIGSFFNREAEQRYESNELDLETKRIQNRILNEELNLMRQPGNPGVAPQEVPPVGTDEYLFRIAYDLNGDPRLMVNQDITENDSDNGGYLSTLQYAYRNGGIGLNGRVLSPALQDKIAADYERATGRKLMSKERLYISPSELVLAGYGAFK